MIKKTILFLLLSFIITIFIKTIIDNKENYNNLFTTKKENLNEENNNKEYTGIVTILNDNKTKKLSGEYVEGKKNGRWFEYWESGAIGLETNYENGVKKGLEIRYYPDGNLYEKGFYINGEKEGQWISYYNSNIIKELTEYKNGKKNGLHVEYNENGSKKLETNYKNGIKNGENKEYYSNGTIRIISYYKEDQLSGKYNFYDNNGTNIFETEFSNGRGYMKLYNDNFQLLMEGILINDKKRGEWKYYNPDGTLKEKKLYN